MTRKQALREAIQIVSKARIGAQRKTDIIAALELCRRELPFTHWTREAVFDACDTWLEEHGQLPLSAFTSPQMPSRPALQNRFGMTAREFRDRYYPLPDRRRQSVQEWNQRFRQDFHRIQCTGQADYNRRRDRALPTWNTVAAMNGLKRWRALLERLDLRTYEKPPARGGIQVRLR